MCVGIHADIQMIDSFVARTLVFAASRLVSMPGVALDQG
jgi:hypothetical protein